MNLYAADTIGCYGTDHEGRPLTALARHFPTAQLLNPSTFATPREAGRFAVEGERCQLRTRPDGQGIYPVANTCRGAYVTSAPERSYEPWENEAF